MLGLFIWGNDADVEECQGICFTECADVIISLAKFPSSSFLLNLILNCASETLVEEIDLDKLVTHKKDIYVKRQGLSLHLYSKSYFPVFLILLGFYTFFFFFF